MKTKQLIEKFPLRVTAAECKHSEAAYSLKLTKNATPSNEKKLNPYAKLDTNNRNS